jgi:uncharacterized protein YhaN
MPRVLQAEVYENSMQLLHGFQRGHNDAQDTSMRRIEFLEKELDQAKAEVARGDEVRRELREKQAECKELAEALEELEAQQGAEIQRAVEAARKEWQAEVAHRERGDETTPVGDPRAEAPTGALPGASVRRQSPGANGAGGEGNPVGDGDNDREKEAASRVVGGLSGKEGDGVEAPADAQERGLGEGGQEASWGQQVEDLQVQLDGVCEERDLLQHRCCDAEEKNKRLERELHRMMDMQVCARM